MHPTQPGADHVLIPNQTGPIILAGVICSALGGLTVLIELVPGISVESPPEGISILGVVVLLLGLTLLTAPLWIRRKRWIEADAHQLRYVDPKFPDEQWRLNWQDLDAVEIHVGRLPAQSVLSRFRPRHRVRLVLFTAGRGRAIEFRSLRASEGVAGPGTFAMFFGDMPKLVQPLDAFLRRNARPRYRRLLDEGLVNNPL
ncbi:hypothetical protein [uncultured Gulosibacter sp.]|uniref:hypothetical protein n=1 Tax=uncultured Gulosibacter sp. TaxID=1339167 RepID=UPI00288B9219|nr:hypothetical protein [uncultured Gulosibacter sp.]